MCGCINTATQSLQPETLTVDLLFNTLDIFSTQIHQSTTFCSRSHVFFIKNQFASAAFDNKCKGILAFDIL